MPSEISNGRHTAWEVLAQFWVDTSYDAGEMQSFAAQLAGCDLSLRELDVVVYGEVAGAFATETLVMFLTLGMFSYDFMFPQDEAREKVAGWLSRPLFLSLMNPFWLVGYGAAIGYLSLYWLPLRRRVIRLLRASPPHEC